MHTHMYALAETKPSVHMLTARKPNKKPRLETKQQAQIRTNVQITQGTVLTSVHVMIVTAHTRDTVHVGLSLDCHADVQREGVPVCSHFNILHKTDVRICTDRT